MSLFMAYDEEKIYRSLAAEELGISTYSLNRAVKQGELHYANPHDPQGKHKYFTRDALDKYRKLKGTEWLKTADTLQRILYHEFPATKSPLNDLIQKHLCPPPLELVLEIVTCSPNSKTKPQNIYRSKFSLFVNNSEEASSVEDAARILALACVIRENDGVCESRDFTVQSSWGPSANRALQDAAGEVAKKLVNFAHSWTCDNRQPPEQHKELTSNKFDLLKKSAWSFLDGSGDGGGIPGRCLVLDQMCLYTNYGQNLINGTRVTAYLVTPLP